MCGDDIILVGTFSEKYNEILGTDYEIHDIYRSTGIPSHMIKRKHFDALKYIDKISDIINDPTYIGINPNEKDSSIELVKEFDKNILIGIKLDYENGYYYVSTMHSVQDNKIERRLHSGRLIRFDNK